MRLHVLKQSYLISETSQFSHIVSSHISWESEGSRLYTCLPGNGFMGGGAMLTFMLSSSEGRGFFSSEGGVSLTEE